MKSQHFLTQTFLHAILPLLTAVTCWADSLPPLKDCKPPATLAELWGEYDPRKEPLETQVVREWTEDGITLRYVVFKIGVFKGKPANLAAFYGFVKGNPKVPGILEVHGGGQRASLDAVRDTARNGYACLSINWGGRKMEGANDGDPNTDWGSIDATQNHNEHYASIKPDGRTLDSVESPRNNNWFMLVLAARRGLTFLEQQPEVDPGKLGVTGHSMGGKITTDLAGIDRRVKAAVPSCGGAGTVGGKLSGMPGSGLKAESDPVVEKTIDDVAYIPTITCPILYLAPSNDFAGPFDNMTLNWKNLGSKEVAHSISPHLNHRHLSEAAICGILWFDAHLKGTFTFPKTPQLMMDLKGAGSVPRATVTPDRVSEVAAVDIYYSVDPHCLTRFWRDAGAKREGGAWVASCPVMSADQPLFVYANVSYKLKTERTGFRGSKAPETFIMSSEESIFLPGELKAAGVKTTDTPSRMIDDFSRGWNDWYRLEWRNPHHWLAATRKIKDLKWRGPEGAKLVFELKCPSDIVLCIAADVNGWGVYPGKPGGSFEARKPIAGSPDWQTVSVALDDLASVQKTPSSTLSSWENVTELNFHWAPSYFKNGQEIKVGPENIQKCGWTEPREFRNLRWEGGQYTTRASAADGKDAKPRNLEETIQKEIKKSL